MLQKAWKNGAQVFKLSSAKKTLYIWNRASLLLRHFISHFHGKTKYWDLPVLSNQPVSWELQRNATLPCQTVQPERWRSTVSHRWPPQLPVPAAPRAMPGLGQPQNTNGQLRSPLFIFSFEIAMQIRHWCRLSVPLELVYDRPDSSLSFPCSPPCHF